MRKHVYLDYNATTPLSDEVVAATKEALIDAWGNPSSLSEEGSVAQCFAMVVSFHFIF